MHDFMATLQSRLSYRRRANKIDSTCNKKSHYLPIGFFPRRLSPFENKRRIETLKR